MLVETESESCKFIKHIFKLFVGSRNYHESRDRMSLTDSNFLQYQLPNCLKSLSYLGSKDITTSHLKKHIRHSLRDITFMAENKHLPPQQPQTTLSSKQLNSQKFPFHDNSCQTPLSYSHHRRVSSQISRV